VAEEVGHYLSDYRNDRFIFIIQEVQLAARGFLCNP